jgi:hypothetical protein
VLRCLKEPALLVKSAMGGAVVFPVDELNAVGDPLTPGSGAPLGLALPVLDIASPGTDVEEA